MIDSDAIRRAGAVLDDAERDFLERVWSADLDVYRARLKAIGFAGHNHVLDAGCGYGQWSLCLAELNERVTAIDAAPFRAAVTHRILNGRAAASRIEQSALQGGRFDAVFSYGVLMYTDLQCALAEAHRLLRRGGTLYFTLTDVGWYLRNVADPTNAGPGYDPRALSVRVIANTIAAYGDGVRDMSEAVVVPHGLLRRWLQEAGFTGVRVGAEGTLRVAEVAGAKSFYPLDYQGLPYVTEVLAQRA